MVHVRLELVRPTEPTNRTIKRRIAEALNSPFAAGGVVVGDSYIWKYLLKKGKVIQIAVDINIVYYKKTLFIFAPDYTSETITFFSCTMIIRILNDIISKRGDE